MKNSGNAKHQNNFYANVFSDKFQKQIFPPFQKYKHTMAVDIAGVVSIVVFYIIVLVVGIVAGKKNKKGNTEELLVAGRHLGLFVASLTSAGIFFYFQYMIHTSLQLIKMK